MTKRANVLGCIAGLLIAAAAVYASIAGLGVLWWGRGFTGAMIARHAPERIRTADVVRVYDYVLLVKPDRIIFRRSRWASIRWGLVCGLAAGLVAVVIAAARKRPLALRTFLAIALAIAAITAIGSRLRTPAMSFARGKPRQIITRTYDVGGGRSGTRMTTSIQTGYDVVLVDGAQTSLLVRLPWNSEADARVWRDLIAAKLESAP